MMRPIVMRPIVMRPVMRRSLVRRAQRCWRVAAMAFASVVVVAACDTSSSQGMQIGGSDPAQTELPRVEVKLPPPPTFHKEHPPATYHDGTLSVYGLRADMAQNLDKTVSVKGIVIEVYECPACPRAPRASPAIDLTFGSAIARTLRRIRRYSLPVCPTSPSRARCRRSWPVRA